MLNSDYHYLLVPGYGGIEMRHWMRHWMRILPKVSIVKQQDFQKPDKDQWVDGLKKALGRIDGQQEVILICHSLGCITSFYAALEGELANNVVAAFMVAMPGETRPEHHDGRWTGFLPYPNNSTSLKSLMLASTNDEYCSVDEMTALSRQLNFELEFIGAQGHLGSNENLGSWERGQTYLNKMLSGLSKGQ